MQVLQKINKYISQILKVALIACFTYMTVVLSWEPLPLAKTDRTVDGGA